MKKGTRVSFFICMFFCYNILMNDDKLNQILEKVEENNNILRKMRRASIWGDVFRIFYWTIIIVSAVGAYWFVQPYVDTLKSSYSRIQNDINSVKEITSKIPTTVGNLVK